MRYIMWMLSVVLMTGCGLVPKPVEEPPTEVSSDELHRIEYERCKALPLDICEDEGCHIVPPPTRPVCMAGANKTVEKVDITCADRRLDQCEDDAYCMIEEMGDTVFDHPNYPACIRHVTAPPVPETIYINPPASGLNDEKVAQYRAWGVYGYDPENVTQPGVAWMNREGKFGHYTVFEKHGDVLSYIIGGGELPPEIEDIHTPDKALWLENLLVEYLRTEEKTDLNLYASSVEETSYGTVVVGVLAPALSYYEDFYPSPEKTKLHHVLLVVAKGKGVFYYDGKEFIARSHTGGDSGMWYDLGLETISFRQMGQLSDPDRGIKGYHIHTVYPLDGSKPYEKQVYFE